MTPVAKKRLDAESITKTYKKSRWDTEKKSRRVGQRKKGLEGGIVKKRLAGRDREIKMEGRGRKRQGQRKKDFREKQGVLKKHR